MKIDPRFERACRAERLRKDRKPKQDLEQKILMMLRSSPTSFSESVYKYAHDLKMKLLGD